MNPYADRTIAAYRMRADEAAESWRMIRVPSRFLNRFARELPKRGRVLDYGCGIGKELAWLRGRGFRAEGVEGTLEFAREARRRCPGVRIRHARFERYPPPLNVYDGIWCNAALIHVPPEEFARQLRKIRAALKPGGFLGLTLIWGRHKGFLHRDWIPGRYFACYWKPEALSFLQEGWQVLSCRIVTGDGRKGRWIQVLCRPENIMKAG